MVRSFSEFHIAMALRHNRSPASLLTWRGLQAWSVGSRASGLCKFFIRIRARPKLRLARLVKGERKAGSSTFFLRWLANVRKKQEIRACLPSCMIGRNGDLESSNGAADPSTYRRVKATNQGEQDAPKITRLGSHSPESAISCLQRQSSSRLSDCLSESSTSTSGCSKLPGSPALLSSKLKGTCTRIVNAAQQYNGPCICELVTGNQFLTHLTAAPVSGSTAKKKANLTPSTGLADESLRQRDSDTSDRIVFFQ